MARDWKALKAEIDAETERIWLVEPEELKKIRLGIIENEAGSGGQYFTTWDFINGMARDYPCGTLYPMLQLAERPETTMDQLRVVWELFDAAYSPYMEYHW